MEKKRKAAADLGRILGMSFMVGEVVLLRKASLYVLLVVDVFCGE